MVAPHRSQAHRPNGADDAPLASQPIELSRPSAKEGVSVRLRRIVRLDRSQSGSALSLSLFASAAVQALNVVTGTLIARTLGPHGRGELTTVLLWPFAIAAVGN